MIEAEKNEKKLERLINRRESIKTHIRILKERLEEVEIAITNLEEKIF